MSLRVLVTLIAMVSAGLSGATEAQQLALAGHRPHFVRPGAPAKAKKVVEVRNTAVLYRAVSLELADASIEEALAELVRHAGVRIAYNAEKLPKRKRISLSAGRIEVAAALTQILFESGLDVAVARNGQLAVVECTHLVAAPSQLLDSGSIAGRVTDRTTGAALAGATVVVEGTGLSTTTAPDGEYRIRRVPAGTHTVSARYVGYLPLAVSVTVTAAEEATAELALAKLVQKLDEIVTITPGGLQATVKALPTPVTIVTANEIDQRRPEALQDVIRQAVPTAVGFKNTIAGPAATQFSVRGASSLSGTGNMKIFIDGLEATRFGFAQVDASSIERIEIIRGPQASTIYGADAATGVVQVFTKRGDPRLDRPQVSLRMQGGLAETPYRGFSEVLRQQYVGSVRGGASDLSYNFGGSYTHLDDYLPDGEISRQSSPSVYGGMGFSRGIFGADLSARYLVNNLPSVFNPLLLDAGFPPFSRPNYQPTAFTNQTYGMRLSLTPNAWWQNQVTVGVDRSDIETTQKRPRFTTPDDTLYTVARSESQKVSVAYNASLATELSRTLLGTLVAGIDHYDQEASAFSTAQALNTRGAIITEPAGALSPSWNGIVNTGYFAQVQMDWHDAVFLTAGVRAEDNSTFGIDHGTPVLPRIGISLAGEIGGTTGKVRAAYGKAFRAPAVGQAFASVLPHQIQLANPLLGPERQDGWDAGVDLVSSGGRVTLSFTLYDQIANDLIGQILVGADPVPTYQYQNIGQVRNTGIEVEASVSAQPLQLRAQYGYVDSRIEDLGPDVDPSGFLQVGERPLDLPAHTAGASVTVTAGPGTTVNAGVTYVGSVRQTDLIGLFQCVGGTGPCGSDPNFLFDYPGFAKVNASVTQSITRQIDGFIAIENLTNNEAYEGANATPVIGRVTMVGMQANF